MSKEGESVTTYRIGDIRPNPFRDIDNYPIDEGKITTLRASFLNTSIWPTVVARLRDDDTPELAFGHHRLEAALREYGPDGDFPLNIEALDDASMLKMMANENMAEYTASASVTQETVRQVVLAYSDGRVDLDGAGLQLSRAETRYAPSFVMGDVRRGSAAHPYNARTVATFLGWDDHKVKEALGALELTERGTFEVSDFRGLTSEQAHAAVISVRAAGRTATARGIDPAPVQRAVARAAITAAKGGAGHERVRETAWKAAERAAPAPVKPVVALNVALELYREVDQFFRRGIPVGWTTKERRAVIQEIAENREAIELRGTSGPMADQIADALDEMAAKATELASLLRHGLMLEAGVTA